jgi:adenylate cyclase
LAPERDEKEELTLSEAASIAGVSPATLRRWGKMGVIPDYRGRWTRAAAAHARIVARLRDQGRSLEEIKQAGEDGRLAFGFVEEMFPHRGGHLTLEDAVRDTGLEPALIERVWKALGLPAWMLARLDEDDLQALRNMAAVLEAGFPLVAFLQAMRVYGYSLRQIADAEARLFRLYVHEPLVMDGVPATQVAEELTELIADLQPLVTPLMVYLHRHFLQNAVEQDLFAAMEADLDGAGGATLGQLRVAIAFADIAGFVQFTEQAGEEQALDLVERFVDAVEDTLPGGARVVKNIGDGVMIVGNDAADLTNWAIDFQVGFARPGRPRIGIHYGRTIYRDGDYFGRNVNLASRVVALAKAGEVMITDRVHALVPPNPKVEFEPVGEVELKGIADPVALYVARPAAGATGAGGRRARG